MAVERRDPVPPGRYSVFILEDEVPGWQAWVDAHPSVKVEAAIQKRAVGGSEETAVFHVDTDGKIIWKNVGSSVLFTLSAPTPWVGLGFPTIESRPLEAWAKEETENPEFIGGSPLDRVRDLLLAAAGVYLGGILLARVIK